MNNIRKDWRVLKSATVRGQWDIETRGFIQEQDSAGRVSWRMVHNWTRHSCAPSKRAAVTRANLLRERGDPLNYEGRAVRIEPRELAKA